MRDIGVARELHRRLVGGIPDSHEEPLREVAGCHCELALFLDSCAGSAIEKMIRQPLQINYKKGTIRALGRRAIAPAILTGRKCHVIYTVCCRIRDRHRRPVLRRCLVACTRSVDHSGFNHTAGHRNHNGSQGYTPEGPEYVIV